MVIVRYWLLICGAALVVALLVVVGERRAPDRRSPREVQVSSAKAASNRTPVSPSAVRPRARDQFVGSAVCAACHRAQSEAYATSHHARALTRPDTEIAKLRFGGAHFDSKLGGTTRFALRDGVPIVITDRVDGIAKSYPIVYVSGVSPIEQYVVSTERGKLQSLGVVWDSRAKIEGGNRWFHVYGASGIEPRDPLFFTAAAQNWNHMCAECHSTFVERGYDSTADRFDTRWAELSVGCEACHGPGAEHVRSAQAASSAHTPVALPVQLKASELWTPSASGTPTPRGQDGVEVEVCAPCHSRRRPIKEGFLANDPFLDSFEPELLRPGRYHADGQVEGEVYEWASFLQSRMYRAGVRCSGCHDAHSGKLYATGNALCVRCHEPARFDVEAHSHHGGVKAPRCIDCHMPAATFMQIDERRDHSIRIPRPDLSVEFGTPNACNACHPSARPSWASSAISRWFPSSKKRPHFVEALGADRKGALDAANRLRRLAEDSSVAAVARATALESLGRYPSEKTIRTLRAALASPEPLIVYGAVLGAAQTPLRERVRLLLPTLEHARRVVRIASGKALASVPLGSLSPRERAALERAFDEVERSFDIGASRAETHVERSAFELERGRLREAEASLKAALQREPCLVEAFLNVADLERQRGDEAAAERAIHAAIACSPQNAAAQHALGLWQVRTHESKPALASLKRAVELAPTDVRFRYVLAVALADNGERNAAIQLLEGTLDRRPNDVNSLRALVTYLRDGGEAAREAEVRRHLEAVLAAE